MEPLDTEFHVHTLSIFRCLIFTVAVPQTSPADLKPCFSLFLPLWRDCTMGCFTQQDPRLVFSGLSSPSPSGCGIALPLASTPSCSWGERGRQEAPDEELTQTQQSLLEQTFQKKKKGLFQLQLLRIHMSCSPLLCGFSGMQGAGMQGTSRQGAARSTAYYAPVPSYQSTSCIIDAH